MPKKNKPTGTDADLNLASMMPLFSDADKAREFVESKRWANGRTCPRRGSDKTNELVPKKAASLLSVPASKVLRMP